jgi:hypothetical protein
MINLGRVAEAQELLDGVAAGSRDAEWYFLKGSIYYSRGWMDDALQSFQKACAMNPQNQEYAAAYNQLLWQRQSGQPRYGGGIIQTQAWTVAAAAISAPPCIVPTVAWIASARVFLNRRRLNEEKYTGGNRRLSAAVCLLMMFMTGLVPFSSYVFPAMAGMVLIAVCTENGTKTALLVFAATSILALLIVPDRQSVMLFIMLLGYYPMLKPKLEKLPFLLSYALKFLLFNAVIIAFYYVMLYIFGVPDMLEGWGDFGKYTAYVVLGMVNFTFFMYDFLLSQVLISISTGSVLKSCGRSHRLRKEVPLLVLRQNPNPTALWSSYCPSYACA